jgi:S1-C subfamily serine protease
MYPDRLSVARAVSCALLLAQLLFPFVAARGQLTGFFLVNRSNQPIAVVYVRPSGTSAWGSDLLGPKSLLPNERAPLNPKYAGNCTFDLRIVYTNHSLEDRQGVDLCQTSEVTFTGRAARVIEPSAIVPTFELLNQSAQAITRVYVSRSGAGKWGQNRLVGVVAPKAKFNVPLPETDGCRYDLMVTYADNSSEVLTSQNTCETRSFSFNGTRAEASGSASLPGQRGSEGVSYGSAFFISDRGHALTNSHVVKECRSLVARLGGQSAPAEVQRSDETNDLALLRVQVQNPVPYARFRARPSLRVGEDIMVAGFPISSGKQKGLTVSAGKVSALTGPDGNIALIQFSAPIQPGNSGGPLLDKGGNLVGVISRRDKRGDAGSIGDIAENLNFAVQGPVARLFLEASGQRVAERSTTTNLSVGDMSDRARDFTFQIECIQ